MERIYLSEAEKVLLAELAQNINYGKCSIEGFSDNEIGVAAASLKEKGFIRAAVNYGFLVDAMILPKGEVYIKDNPSLENPVSDEELKKLQYKELLYKKTIRMQERIIRTWQVISAIIGIIGIAGWLLAVLL